ncbi:MAG: DUF3556 domain-containing protein [Pirellulales bacterium]|nr:DUF3556 domain-containing protein [Pirellulales bacterium]
MGLLKPTPLPYDPLEWVKLPFRERAQQVCRAWALQGYGAPLAIYFVYALKIAAYIGAWIYFCSWSPSLGGWTTFSSWWLEPLAFQKAILWSMLFEGLGLGCGSGPLTGRYFPPIGGALYFLRPGTLKRPFFAGLPGLGGNRRTWIDVALYLALIVCLLRALVAPALAVEHLLPIALLVPVLGLADQTVFLALRAEHFWTVTLCFLLSSNWIAGAKCVQLALWFWAGVSKLNHHFPTVVCVMTSNSPFTRFAWLRRRMYAHYPDDLRPSRLAVALAHFGAALEFSVPLTLAFVPGEFGLKLGMVLMLMLHVYITSNVPMAVPIEWNFLVVYSGFALFWAHPEVSPLDLRSAPLAALLLVALVLVPLVGNLFPERVSFLLSMRYYAGNWPYGVWLFRGDSYRKLDQLTKSSPWVYDQLERFYNRSSAVGLVGMVMGFRLMHLHGRALADLIPRAVDRLQDYEYMDGEIICGIVLGWNFGDGHLHGEPLIQAIQQQCHFESGELRCILIEAQSLVGRTLAYRIVDAHDGQIEQGALDIATLRHRQPWE